MFEDWMATPLYSDGAAFGEFRSYVALVERHDTCEAKQHVEQRQGLAQGYHPANVFPHGIEQALHHLLCHEYDLLESFALSVVEGQQRFGRAVRPLTLFHNLHETRAHLHAERDKRHRQMISPSLVVVQFDLRQVELFPVTVNQDLDLLDGLAVSGPCDI